MYFLKNIILVNSEIKLYLKNDERLDQNLLWPSLFLEDTFLLLEGTFLGECLHKMYFWRLLFWTNVLLEGTQRTTLQSILEGIPSKIHTSINYIGEDVSES